MSKVGNTTCLADLVTKHVRSGQPFHRSTSGVFESADFRELLDAFRPCLLHDTISDDRTLRKEIANAKRNGYRGVSLEFLLNRRVRKNKSSPNAKFVLDRLRLFFYKLIVNLSDASKRSLSHLYQVFGCPDEVRLQMVDWSAVSFGASRESAVIADGLIPLDDCRAYRVFVDTFFDPPSSCIDEFSIRVAGFGLALVRENSFSLSSRPSGGSIRSKCARLPLPSSWPGVFDIAINGHEALEDSAVTGLNIDDRLLLPRAYVTVGQREHLPDESEECRRDILDVLMPIAYRRIDGWFEETDGCRAPSPPPILPGPVDSFAWQRFLAEQDVWTRLLFRSKSVDGYLAQLGQSLSYEFLRRVWLSERIQHDGNALLPIELLPEAPQEDCLAYVRFDHSLLGACVRNGGAPVVDPRRSAVQVVSNQVFEASLETGESWADSVDRFDIVMEPVGEPVAAQ